jgi:two-component system response regulator HydG
MGVIGTHASWRQVLHLAGAIAATRASLLICGEPGTGKGLLARLIHLLGPNPDDPFITIDGRSLANQVTMRECQGNSAATANTSLVWSNELVEAQRGTLYLDEVAALSNSLQLDLLRELERRDDAANAAYPRPRDDVQLLMSTSENLPALIEQGRFREDLYHRVGVISLVLPPLRLRGPDITLLAESFRARYAQEFHKAVMGFTRGGLDVLERHNWPGNVRELEAAVQRAVALCHGREITSKQFAPIRDHRRLVRRRNTPRRRLPMAIRPLKEALGEPEKRFIIQALQAFEWDRQETARGLGINRTTLYHKMTKYNLINQLVEKGGRFRTGNACTTDADIVDT